MLTFPKMIALSPGSVGQIKLMISHCIYLVVMLQMFCSVSQHIIEVMFLEVSISGTGCIGISKMFSLFEIEVKTLPLSESH